MATYDSLITGTNAKVAPPQFSPGGNRQSLPSTQTINTATLVANDFQRLWEVRNGVKIDDFDLKADDGDTNGSPTLDMDMILRDDSGDAILLNAGTAFQSAYALTKTLCHGRNVVAEDNGVAYVGFLVNTAAATGVAAMGVTGILGTSS